MIFGLQKNRARRLEGRGRDEKTKTKGMDSAPKVITKKGDREGDKNRKIVQRKLF